MTVSGAFRKIPEPCPENGDFRRRPPTPGALEDRRSWGRGGGCCGTAGIENRSATLETDSADRTASIRAGFSATRHPPNKSRGAGRVRLLPRSPRRSTPAYFRPSVSTTTRQVLSVAAGVCFPARAAEDAFLSHRGTEGRLGAISRDRAFGWTGRLRQPCLRGTAFVCLVRWTAWGTAYRPRWTPASSAASPNSPKRRTTFGHVETFVLRRHPFRASEPRTCLGGFLPVAMGRPDEAVSDPPLPARGPQHRFSGRLSEVEAVGTAIADSQPSCANGARRPAGGGTEGPPHDARGAL